MFDGGDISVIATSLAAIAALIFLRRYMQQELKGDGKLHPPSLPFLPLIAAIIRGGMSAVPEHFMRSAEKLGPIFCCTIGKRLVVVLNGYEVICDAMLRHSEAFSDRVPLYTDKEIVNHELRGIVYSHYDDRYKKNHKITLSILKEFGFGVQGVSETRILQEVEILNDNILKLNGRPFDPKWPFSFSTSDVMTSILFGKDFLKSLPNEHSTIVKSAVQCMENIDNALNLTPIVRFLPAYRKKLDILRSCYKSMICAIEVGIKFNKSNDSEPTFVRRFLEVQGTDYDHTDLLFVLRDLCLASTETVSTTLMWAMVELANHPEIQNRLQSEIDENVPAARFPSLDDKPRLPYTEVVILELMRRRTISPLFIPHGTLRDAKLLDYNIPKGCWVIANGYSAHMDPRYWKDPENFRPERFLDADNKIINAHRVIPFGLGKRSCIGEILARQSVFLFLTSLVQRFEIRPLEGQKSINVKEIFGGTTGPSPFEVRLISRERPTLGLA